MRANLFASATPTTLWWVHDASCASPRTHTGRLLLSKLQNPACALYEQSSQIAAPSFADAEQFLFACGRVFANARDRVQTSTARVTTKDLAETKDVQGTLGYGATRDIAFAGRGTVTALADVGTTVGRGGKLGEVNGQPVTLFFGDRPAWRDLQPGVSDGADIEQLEANLIALGYGTHYRLGPNRQWNNETTDAVKRWLERVQPDLLFLQEIKCETAAFPT